jgi:hypothetical protein
VDSELTDVQLESRKRATKALVGLRDKRECHKGLKVRVEVRLIAQKTLLSKYRTTGYATLYYSVVSIGNHNKRPTNNRRD